MLFLPPNSVCHFSSAIFLFASIVQILSLSSASKGRYLTHFSAELGATCQVTATPDCLYSRAFVGGIGVPGTSKDGDEKFQLRYVGVMTAMQLF
jgi:hypothetical protein